jgi:hypothetical protein
MMDGGTRWSCGYEWMCWAFVGEILKSIVESTWWGQGQKRQTDKQMRLWKIERKKPK